MKKVIFWVLLVVLTCAISVAGTIAYLSNTDQDVNVMTIGNVKIDQLEYERTDIEANGDDAVLQEFQNDKPLFPAAISDGFDWNKKEGSVDWEQIGKDGTGAIWDPDQINNEQDKMVFVNNIEDHDAYVRTVFAVEAGRLNWEEFQEKIHLNLNDTDWIWEWIETPVVIGDGTYFLATATYTKPLKSGEMTEPSLIQVALDPLADNEDTLSFGNTYVILTESQAIQSDGFSDAVTALEDGFGKIAVNNHPFMLHDNVTYIYNEVDLKRVAERGGLGLLMNDIEITSRTYFSKAGCVLDMQGHTIKNSNMEIGKTQFAIRVDSGGSLIIKGNGKILDNHVDKEFYYNPGIFCVSGAGSVLTIEDGYYDVGSNDSTNMLVQAQSNGKFVVKSGTFVNVGSSDAADMIYGMSGGTIEIYGGFFRNDGRYRSTINLHDGRPGNVLVMGGTFVNHYPGKTNDPSRVKVMEGYTVAAEEQPNGEIWYKVVPVN